MAALNPINGGTGVDFTGAEYEIESLPYAANEGDTCTICWPGGSGWYQTGYIFRDGEWIQDWTTAPWQLTN